ncbi:MAG: iron-sulfur cluster-binding domain-containing protein [Williamsia sp.]|nr:iron-sulfur cluster-binding domain-containing protein [Williamsia sp.]
MNTESMLKRLSIVKIQEEANKIKLFYLQEEKEKIQYKAGQYLTFILPQSEHEIRRSYSLVSSPGIDEQLCIAVKRIQNGVFSRHLFDRAQIGDQLITLGAGGVFVLPDDIGNYETLFFFAAGSGIVPVFSLIKTALILHPYLRIALIYSNSSAPATLFREPLKRLAEAHAARFTIDFIFSNAKHLEKAHLQPHLIEQFVARYRGGTDGRTLYYICGPDSYMRMCTFTLRRLEVPSGNIKKEIFNVTKPVQSLVPPDTAPHTVTLLRGQEQHSLLVQHPDSILMVAKQKGILLPYSCQVGRCGNCIAKCEKGQVWMSYNEVLTEKEILNGYILTCTGYPIGGDAIIRY